LSSHPHKLPGPVSVHVHLTATFVVATVGGDVLNGVFRIATNIVIAYAAVAVERTLPVALGALVVAGNSSGVAPLVVVERPETLQIFLVCKPIGIVVDSVVALTWARGASAVVVAHGATAGVTSGTRVGLVSGGTGRGGFGAI
jgi:hypothetical protein